MDAFAILCSILAPSRIKVGAYGDVRVPTVDTVHPRGRLLQRRARLLFSRYVLAGMARCCIAGPQIPLCPGTCPGVWVSEGGPYSFNAFSIRSCLGTHNYGTYPSRDTRCTTFTSCSIDTSSRDRISKRKPASTSCLGSHYTNQRSLGGPELLKRERSRDSCLIGGKDSSNRGFLVNEEMPVRDDSRG